MNKVQLVTKIRDEFMPIIDGKLIAAEVDTDGSVKALVFKRPNGSVYSLSESYFANGGTRHLNVEPYEDTGAYETVPVELDIDHTYKCPHCHQGQVFERFSSERTQIVCEGCRMSGPLAQTTHEAVLLWNKIVHREEEKPEMSRKSPPCQYCSVGEPTIIDDDGKFYVFCPYCKTKTGQHALQAQAINAWEQGVTNHISNAQPCPDCTPEEMSIEYVGTYRGWGVICHGCGFTTKTNYNSKIEALWGWGVKGIATASSNRATNRV